MPAIIYYNAKVSSHERADEYLFRCNCVSVLLLIFQGVVGEVTGSIDNAGWSSIRQKGTGNACYEK